MIKVSKAALDSALEQLSETGWDIDKELQRLELQIELPVPFQSMLQRSLHPRFKVNEL